MLHVDPCVRLWSTLTNLVALADAPWSFPFPVVELYFPSYLTFTSLRCSAAYPLASSVGPCRRRQPRLSLRRYFTRRYSLARVAFPVHVLGLLMRYLLPYAPLLLPPVGRGHRIQELLSPPRVVPVSLVVRPGGLHLVGECRTPPWLDHPRRRSARSAGEEPPGGGSAGPSHGGYRAC